VVVWAWERPAERNAVSQLKAAGVSSGSGGLPARRPYPHRNTTATAGVELKCLITGMVPTLTNF
jgi:hypothetical protein